MNKNISKKHSFLEIIYKSYPHFFHQMGLMLFVIISAILNYKFINWSSFTTDCQEDLFKLFTISLSLLFSIFELGLFLTVIEIIKFSKEMIIFWLKLRYLPLTEQEMRKNGISSINDYSEWIKTYIGEDKCKTMPFFMQKEIGNSVHLCFDEHEIATYIKENENFMHDWILRIPTYIS